ncbi:MAG: hypothetical protein ABIR04_11655, partial [Cypionkella sp.]
MTLFLENEWASEPAPAGTWTLRLTNLSETVLTDFTLSVTTITRIMPEHYVEGGRFLRRTANFHEFAPFEGVRLAPGDAWTLRAEGLFRSPFHRNDAAKTAWVTVGGTRLPVHVGDLIQASGAPALPPPRLPL